MNDGKYFPFHLCTVYQNRLLNSEFFIFLAEEVIKRRLLIDGDGTGDDRRFTILLKSFVKWCNSENESPRETYVLWKRIYSFPLFRCQIHTNLYFIIVKS